MKRERAPGLKDLRAYGREAEAKAERFTGGWAGVEASARCPASSEKQPLSWMGWESG